MLIFALLLALNFQQAPQGPPDRVMVVVRNHARFMTWDQAVALLRTTKDPAEFSGLVMALGANTFCREAPECAGGRCAGCEVLRKD